MRRIVIDLDGTLAGAKMLDYSDCPVREDVAKQVRAYRELGFEIVISTARGMRTYKSNVGKITAKTLPVIVEWLERHDIPYDEIWVGKPWCGTEGFYVDDRAIRPEEFSSMSYEEIMAMIAAPDHEGRSER